MTDTLDLDTLHLDKGSHRDRDTGVCLLEAVAWFAGKKHTDYPLCVSPILGAYGRNLNDALPDDKRQQLKPFIPRLVGTAEDGHDQIRGLMAADWVIRTYTPTWLRLAGLQAEAVSLETLPRQTSWDDVEAAVPILRAAGQKTYAAWAARDAAQDAARDALRPTLDVLQDSAIDLYDRMISAASDDG